MEIKIKDIFKRDFVLFREDALKIRDIILTQNEKEVILDFNGIEIKTIGFVDEYLKVKKFLQNLGYVLKEKNLEPKFDLFKSALIKHNA